MNANLKVPFVDLARIHEPLLPKFADALTRHIAQSDFVLGKAVDYFESEFAQISRLERVVAVNSGTSALHLSLIALGVGSGDEVIVPSLTFMASAAAISYVGAVPVFVDVCEETWNLDAAKIESAITSRTRAIIVVHLHGLMADMIEIRKIASSRGLFLIEDAAQAHLASIGDSPVGTFGDISCFSFYPGKNLGALGEGGAVSALDPSIDKKIRLLRNWYSETKYLHLGVGYNYRMESIQAEFLRIKLPHLASWTHQRQAIAKSYESALGPVFEHSKVPNGYQHVRHIFAIRVLNRDQACAHLDKCGIGWGLHYPVPLHLQPAYAHLGYKKGSLPVSEKLAEEILSLPIFPGMTTAQIDRVIDCIFQLSSGQP